MRTSHTIKEHAHENEDKSEKKIKGGCQLGKKVVTHNSKGNLPLATTLTFPIGCVKSPGTISEKVQNTLMKYCARKGGHGLLLLYTTPI